MTDYPILRSVEAVGEFTARLDLNDREPFWTGHDDFTLGAPAYDAAPRAVGVTYREREVTFRAFIDGDLASAAGALQALSRELMRAETVWLFQATASSDPMWVHAWQSSPDALSWEEVRVDEETGETLDRSYVAVDVTLVSDPFVYGEPVTMGPYELANNPLNPSTVVVRNKVPNPSFEAATTGWEVTVGSLSRVTGQAVVGSWTGRWNLNLITGLGELRQTAANRCPVDPADIGVPQKYGVYHRWPGAPGATTTMQLRLQVRFYNAGGVQVGSTVTAPETFSPTPSTGFASMNATPPATATSAQISIAKTNAAWADPVYVDAFRFGPVNQDYGDGSGVGWGWSGTPNLSPSGPVVPTGQLPARVALPPIPGDAPAPLKMRLLPSIGWTHNDVAVLVTAFTDAVAADAAVIPIDDAWSGAGAATSTPSAAMVSGQYRETTGAAALTRTVTVAPGRYRAYVRMAKDVTAPLTLAVSLASGSTRLTDPAMGIFDATGGGASFLASYVDLGEVTLPPGTDAKRLSGGAAEFSLTLGVTKPVGTGQGRLDALVLIPVSSARIAASGASTLEFRAGAAPAVGTSGIAAVLDGDERTTWQESSAGIASGSPAIARGGFPRVWPGADNVLYLLAQTATRGTFPTAGSDVVTATCEVELEVTPRYLHLPTGA
ncbi:hypothetical protein [Mumia sp. DW29H23]|uniref:hypothetical protein n=1 Tax=Mumia sp. DW29H23 TaxID=3421241 RepID=UPI003D68408C